MIELMTTNYFWYRHSYIFYNELYLVLRIWEKRKLIRFIQQSGRPENILCEIAKKPLRHKNDKYVRCQVEVRNERTYLTFPPFLFLLFARYTMSDFAKRVANLISRMINGLLSNVLMGSLH